MRDNDDYLKKVVSVFTEDEAEALCKAITCDLSNLEELQSLGTHRHPPSNLPG